MTRYFVSQTDGTVGGMANICHGPYVVKADVMSFLSKIAPPGDWFVFGPEGVEKFNVPERIVTLIGV